MKRVLGLSVAFASLMSVSQLASADLFEGLNKAADAANRINTTAQAAKGQATSVAGSQQTLKSMAAEKLLNRALGDNIDVGVTTRSDLVELLGSPVKSKVKGKVETLTYRASGVAEQLGTVQVLANTLGVSTPKIVGDVLVTLQDGKVGGVNLANFSAQ